jgi:hypothetical protein
MQEY